MLVTLAVALLGGDALADPASPLTVVKSGSANPVASGAQLTYTIVVTNTGGAALGNVVLTDQVNGVGVIQSPPALPQLIITSTKGSCTQGGPNGNLVTCNAGTLAGGESFTVTIRGQVTAGAGTTLNNTASVTATKSAQNFTTLSNPLATLVTGGGGPGQPDLTINKTGPTSVAPSAAMTYTLTVNNLGTANATNVKVVDTLPAGVALVSTSTTSLFTCSSAGAPVTVTCTGGAVNQGQNGTITINATAPAATGQITNTAVVDPDNSIAEPNELNNTSAAVNTNVGGPPPNPLLDIKKTDGNPAPGAWGNGAGPDPVNPGQTLTYKILVTNTATGSNSRADDVVTTDSTQGLEASSITASQTVVNGSVGTTGGCVVIAPQVRCSLKSLNSGGTQAITISGTVLQSAGSSIFNTATVTGNIKNQGVTNTASEVTTIRPQYDLTITKGDSPDPVCARSWPVDGTSTLPPPLNNTNQHLPNPPFGLTPAAGTVTTPPGLVANPVCLGGLTYTFVVGNSGIADLNGNVTVRDPLPAGLIFDSYSTDGGFTCAVDAANVVTCTGGSIPAASTREIKFLVVAPPFVGTIANTATVDPNNAIFEADETNNMVTEATGISTGIDLVVWKGDRGDPDPPQDPPGTAPPLTEGFDPIATSGTGTYTIIVDNVGTQDSTGIKVRDTLPAGTKFLSVTSDQGFTCSHDGSPTGGNVTCISGHLLGTESEFYQAPGAGPAPGDEFATIKIKFFATPFVQPAMHNEVRVDPDNEIAEVNELNNLATDDTVVATGNADKGAFNQLTVTKTQTDPSVAAGDPDATVAQNGTLIYNLHVENLGTDPVSNVVVKDFLPSGSRFISAKDTATGSAAFFCTHDGSATGGTITCVGGDFSGSLNTIPGVPTNRDIKVTIFAPNTPGTYTNHATVDPDNVVPEGNEFDNDSAVDTTVTVGGNNMFNELNLTKQQTSPLTECGGVKCVATSSIVEYTLVVKNDGSDPAFQVNVRDTLPAGFTFISADDAATVSDPNAFQCTNTGNVVNCIAARIDGGGATRTIIVKAFSATQPGTYVNQAVVDPNNAIPEGNETNNTAQATTRVVVGAGFIDLRVGKSGPAGITPGATITYGLTVQNLGTDPAFNVKVRDDLPEHTTFVSAVDTTPEDAGAFSCSLVGASILCTGGTLDGTTDVIPGPPNVPDTRTIEIKVLAPASIEEFSSDQANISLDIFNRAIVDPDNTVPESNETNNASANVKTTVQSAINLKLDKQGPGSATQNDITTYTITVTNEKKGPTGATAFGVKIVDPLPVGLIPLEVLADPGNFTCQIQENPVNFVTCIGDLETTKTVTITIKAFVTQNGGELDNEACVDPDHTIAETNELDNCKHAIGQVLPPAPDVLINKSADKSTVTAGEELTYTLGISNVGTGDTDGTDVTVTDTVPSEVTVTNINPAGGWDCSATVGNDVSCTRSSILKGDSSQIVITTTAGATLTAPFTNTATVSGGGDAHLNNNSDSVTTSVGGAAIDLTVVSITDEPDPVNRSNQLTYTAIVRNDGTSGASPDAIVRVELPDAGIASFSVAATNGFNCSANTTVDASGHTFDCVGDFAASGQPGDSTEVTAVMSVTPSAPNDLKLTVTVDPELDFGESDETNNTLSQTTTVSGTVCTGSPCVDLVAADIFDNPDPVDASDGVIEYVASIVNIGDAAVDPTATWTIDITYTGPGNPVLSGVDTSQCVAVPNLNPLIHHARCTSKAGAGTDWMDLGPGGGVTLNVSVTGATTAGPASLKVELDKTSPVIAEFDETNNALTETTTIVP